jgi:predicted DNA binding protein
MGYYDVPRPLSTDRLAWMLKTDKGIVGMHMRRAERNLLNSLLA